MDLLLTDWDELPQPGSRWIWALGKLHAEEHVIVTQTRWNGEEWMVQTRGCGTGERYWNDLSRFREAATAL